MSTRAFRVASCSCLALLLASALPAQAHYPGTLLPLSCPGGGGAAQVPSDGVLADLDQDGDEDFVGVLLAGLLTPVSAIGVSRSSGGTLGPITCYPTGAAIPTQVAVGDLNGDGFRDLVATCAAVPASVLVMLNDGTGGFPSILFNTPMVTGYHGVHVGVVDGDALPDVVLTNPGGPLTPGGAAVVLPGTGGGFLGAAFPGPTTFTGTVIVHDDDFDGDADLHEVAATMFLTYRNSLGTFSAVFRFAAATMTGYPAFADLNLDGNLDAAFVGRLPAVPPAAAATFIQVAFGNAAGVLTATPIQTIGTAPTSTWRVDLRDFDGDSDADLIVASGSGLFYSTNVGATFQPATLLAQYTHGAVAGDVTGDGLADVAGRFFLFSSPPAVPIIGWSLLPGLPGQGLAPLTERVMGATVTGKAFVLGDANADGWTDAMISSQSPSTGTPNTVGMTHALDVNVVGAGTGFATASASEYVDFASGDFNGDAVTDVLTARANAVELAPGAVAIAWGYQPVFSGTGIVSVAAGDVNGDGNLDAIVNQVIQVSVVFGTGTGSFTGPAIVTPICPNPVTTACPTAATIAVADVNADGFLDLVAVLPASGASAPNFTVYTGNGTGTFSAGTTTVCAPSTWPPELADVNGDGATDLVLSTTVGGLEVRLGVGGGAFGAPANHSIVFPGAPWFLGGELALRDVDSNGLPDAALAGGAVFLNDGAGGFVQHQVLAAVSGLRVGFVEADLDLQPDLVFYSVPGFRLTTFRNLRSCTGTGYPFGFGCPGSGGFVPELTATGCATSGGTVVLRVERALGGAAAGAFVAGPGAPMINPIAPGCSALLQLAGSVVAPFSIAGPPIPGQGSNTTYVPLPPTILWGTSLTIQAAVLDPAAALGWSATNAVSLIIQ